MCYLGTTQNLRIPNFVTKYVIFCELWVKMSVPDIKNLGLDRDSWNLYPLYPLFPCSDFVSQMWGGGGGCNVFLTFYAISNISRKKIWEYKTIISHFNNVFFVCFFVCWKY